MSTLTFIIGASLLAFGAEALVTEHNYHSKIVLEPCEIEAVIGGLDLNNDKKICSKDLDSHYYYSEAACAKKRFIEWIDVKDKDGAVSKEELTDFISSPIVRLAIHECVFIHSQSLKESCFADQILTYIYLVLDKCTVTAFFNEIEKPDDDNKDITLDELDAYLKKAKVESKVTYCEDDVKNMLIEIGGDNGQITHEEFEAYVTQEELHDDFRICRTELDKASCATKYDFDCLAAELLDYTMNEFTERDCQDTFAAYDKDKDGDIEANEIKNGCPDCSDEDVKTFIKMMDRSKHKDGVILYSEFRAFATSHWVKMEMEKDCASKKKAQGEEVACFIQQINELVKEQYTRIWLYGSDLDMAMEFEALDANDNGRIELEEDLKGALKWDEKAAKNFIAEFDGPDQDVHVSLEEFNEVTDEPFMVYATVDCMDHILDKKPHRIDCYNKELHDTLINILDKTTVKAFFDYYDGNKCGKITMNEVIQRGIKDEDSQNFMQEMGMGDETVNFREFSWYVKQQRITKMFTDNKCGTDTALLHVQLVEYHEKVFTEYDTQELFDELEADHDWEMSSKDCGKHNPEKHKSFLARVDRKDDDDNTVNFLEFWLYLNTPLGGPVRKLQLEEACTKVLEKQTEEMACYLEHIWDVQ